MSKENTTSNDEAGVTNSVANHPRVQSVLTLDQDWIERGLTIGVFLLSIVFLFETRKYDWAAQRVPVFVFGLVLVLSSIEILKQFDVISWGESEGDDGGVQKDVEERTAAAEEEMSLDRRRMEMLRMVTWIVSLLLVVYVVGLLPGSLLFLLAFYYAEADVGILRTVVFSAAVFLFVWIVFEILLKARLYPGLFELGEFFYVSGSLF